MVEFDFSNAACKNFRIATFFASRVPSGELIVKHRETHRDKVLKPASIEFDETIIDCTVRNISTSGAMLDASGSTTVPAHFTLALLFEGSRKPCKRIWRKQNRLGVEFEQVSFGTGA